MKYITFVWSGLLLLCVFFTPACHSEREKVGAHLNGRWYLQGNPETCYTFYRNGELLLQKGQEQKKGQWKLAGKGIECVWEGERQFYKFAFAGDTLYWNSSFLLEEAAVPLLPEALIGVWHRPAHANREEAYVRFLRNGTMHRKNNPEAPPDQWYVRQHKIVLNGAEAEASTFYLEGDSLHWGGQLFLALRDYFSSAVFCHDITGKWVSNNDASGSRALFFPDGTYNLETPAGSIPGIWKYDGKEVLVNGPLEGRFSLSANGTSLASSQGQLGRTQPEDPPRWQFFKKGREVVAEDNQTNTRLILARDSKGKGTRETYRVVSQMGRRVSLLMERTSRLSGHPSYARFLTFDGSTGRQLTLTDLFEEEAVVKVLMQQEVVSKQWSRDQHPQGVQELIRLVQGDCSASMGRALVDSFAFLYTEAGTLVLVAGFPALCETGSTGMTKVLYRFDSADYLYF